MNVRGVYNQRFTAVPDVARCRDRLLSRLHTSKFSLTSVIDNVDMLMCMNAKFSLTSFSLTSFICWCERINEFSLTSFHGSQQYNYTVDEKKNNNHEAPISFLHHRSRLFDERKKVAGSWSGLCFTNAI